MYSAPIRGKQFCFLVFNPPVYGGPGSVLKLCMFPGPGGLFLWFTVPIGAASRTAPSCVLDLKYETYNFFVSFFVVKPIQRLQC